MKLLIIDNYDSFTYNLIQLVEQLFVKISYQTFYNDQIQLEEVKKFDKILLSPGAGIPSEAGIMLELIKHYTPSKSILGVCLGHQAVAESFGAKLKNLPFVQHGQIQKIRIIQEDYLFDAIPKNIEVGLYHSWAVSEEKLPKDLEVTSKSNETIMSIAHKKFDVKGIQFHPESVMTPYGKNILYNWLKA